MRTILEAVKKSGRRAVIGSGWAGFRDEPLPEDVFLLDYAPYAWLLPRMAAVVHHGGSGTTGLALQYGVPSMAVPFTSDQAYWGERIRALGCGLGPIPIRRLTAGRLAAALARLMSDPELRTGAAAMAEQLRAENGLANAVRVIRGCLRESKA